MVEKVNQARLDELRLLMAEDFPLLVTTYLEAAGQSLEKMQVFYAERCVDALSTEAHSMKGASSNLGLNALVAELKQLEDLARQRSWKEVESLLENIAADVAEIRELLGHVDR